MFKSDKDFILQSFMVTPRLVEQTVLNRRVKNSAQYKFTDTTLGGNRYINSLPQFTSNADIKEKPYSISKGMGRFYSEMFDDNAVVAHLRFGTAEHNSLSGFFFNYFSPALNHLAKTGEDPGLLYHFAKGLTMVSTLTYQTAVYTARAFGGMARYLQRRPYSKYYYLKPAMALYWSAVNTMVNTIGVNKGIIGPIERDVKGEKIGTKALSHSELRAYSRLLPDIFELEDESHGIDVYRIANRAQRLSDLKLEAARDEANKATNKAEYEAALAQLDSDGNPRPIDPKGIASARLNLPNYIKEYNSTKGLYVERTDVEPMTMDGKKLLGEDGKPVSVPTTQITVDQRSESYLNQLSNNLTANRRDGSEWISFKIIPERTASESFSNEVGDSEISEKMKGTGQSMASLLFSLGGGNIGDGALSGMVESAMSMVNSMVMGATDALHIGGLYGIFVGSFPDIPKHWKDSSAELTKISFSIPLRSVYGHPLATFMKCDIPLAMLLAGALPISTGRHSYQSPLVCEYYCKSRGQTRLGIIDSLTVTRGAGTIGWTVDQFARGIDVDVSIVDLSSVMHMPVTESLNFIDDVVGMGMFSDDNAFTDYMATLGGLGFEAQVYPLDGLQRKRYLGLEKFNDWLSPSHVALEINETWVGRKIAAFSNRRFNTNME